MGPVATSPGLHWSPVIERPSASTNIHDHPPWLHRLTRCRSTNTWARERLNRLEHGAVVWTDHQEGGRGQHGRRWLAPPGTLAFSVVIHLVPAADNRLLALLAGLAVAYAIEDLPGPRIMLKWPNDCYLGGGKLAGILCEGRLQDGCHQQIVGIGLNLDPDWREHTEEIATWPRPPARLADHLERAPEPLQLIAATRDYLLQATAMLGDGRGASLLDEIRARDYLAGRALVASSGTRQWQGTGGGINDDGSLLLALPQGGIINVDSATVTPGP